MTKGKEDKITASEMRYRRLFESAKDGIIILDATSGQVQDANPFLLNLLGYTLEELLGKELWEIGLFQDINTSRAAFLELQDNNYIRYEDLPLETRDGRQIEVEFVSNVYLVNDEKVIQCNIRDITARKRAEQAITASEMRYRRLFESAKDGIIILDATSGQVQDANPFLLNLLGYSLKDLLGKELWEIGLFQDISTSRAAFLELQDKDYIRYEDLPLETRDGRQIEVEFVSNVYLVNDDKVIQCNIRDITERKRAEQALRKNEALLSQMGGLTKTGGWEFDVDTMEQVWTDVVYQIFELEPSPAPNVAEGIVKFIKPVSKPLIEQAIQRTIAFGEPYDLELEVITAKGNHRWVKALGKTYQDDEKNQKVFGIIQDITERKQAENAIRKLDIAVEQSGNSIIITDLEGTIEYVNRKFTEVTGYTRVEAGRTHEIELRMKDFEQEIFIQCSPIAFSLETSLTRMSFE